MYAYKKVCSLEVKDVKLCVYISITWKLLSAFFFFAFFFSWPTSTLNFLVAMKIAIYLHDAIFGLSFDRSITTPHLLRASFFKFHHYRTTVVPRGRRSVTHSQQREEREKARHHILYSIVQL